MEGAVGCQNWTGGIDSGRKMVWETSLASFSARQIGPAVATDFRGSDFGDRSIESLQGACQIYVRSREFI